MEEIEEIVEQLSDDVIVQIKDFDYWNLTEAQESLIDELILDEELNMNYKWYGLCHECDQPKSHASWCRICNAERFRRNFKNWSSGNDGVDKFIRKTQLKATQYNEALEWIENDRFENIEYLAKGGFGTVYKAIWKDGPTLKWENNQWEREGRIEVALKCLHNSQDITVNFLKEVRFFL
jgi:hypothetical protein